MRLHEKIKNIYISTYHTAYGHQTWQVGNLTWEARIFW